MPAIAETWRQIEEWLVRQGRDPAVALGAGASDAAIAAAEKTLGCRLPEAFVASARLHDGEGEPIGLIGGWELLSLSRICDEWQVWNGLFQAGDFSDAQSDPEPGIKADWWNPRWIPITYSGSGDHHCLDLDPAPDGTPGQVIQMWHDWQARTRAAIGFDAWLADFAADLARGRYELRDRQLAERE